LFKEELWNKLAVECGHYGAWMRCTGGGEPMLHPRMVDMIEFAKTHGARVWLNTNGSMFGPTPVLRQKLERVIAAGIDLIEFSMDAGDAATYAMVRPPHRGGPPRDPEKWWGNAVGNVRAALELRRRHKATTRIVVSIIRQQQIEGKLDAAIDFWMKDVGVDEVITRKFLTWDDNTQIDMGKALDPHLYAGKPTQKTEPVRVAVRTAARGHTGTYRAVRSGHLLPDGGAVSQRQRRLHRGDLERANASIGTGACTSRGAALKHFPAAAAPPGSLASVTGTTAGSRCSRRPAITFAKSMRKDLGAEVGDLPAGDQTIGADINVGRC
jgi:hypothetical protein